MTETVFNLSTLNGTNGFTIINGNNNDDHLGYSISNAGDVNGDGINDIIIGAYLADPNGQSNAGSSYVVFGTNNGFPATIDISTLNGINGFTLIGSTEGEASGRSVSAAGDINGDGIDDLIIGAPLIDVKAKNAGKAYIVFGKSSFSSTPTINLSNLNGNNGFIINGAIAEDQLGYTVSNAGDINKDGFDDLIIAASNAYTDPNGLPGKAYIIFGQQDFNSDFDLTSLNGSKGFVINGLTADDYLGFAVSSAGDINNDGIDDIIIGAHFADPNGSGSGRAYIVFGSEEEFSSNLDLSNLDGSNGFIINGQDDDQLGFSVSSAGDVNNDGIDDIIVGAHFASPNGVYAAGISYVVFGKDGNFDPIFDLSTLNGNNGFAINGIGELNNSGWAVKGVGDVSGDGIDDILVSAKNADPNGEYSGQNYVIFGKSNFTPLINLADIDGTNGFVINGKSEGDNLGHSVSGGGDVNGDGISDLILSAPFADSATGEGYVIFGINSAPTDVLLSTDNVDENVAAETVIGKFTTVDPNVKVQNFTYTLVAGAADNDAFIIDGDTLKIKQSPDFETKSSYLLRVKTTDQGGLSYQKELTINVNDIDETGGNTGSNAAPTDLVLSAINVDENVAAETIIGIFSTTDSDSGDTFTYSLVDDENYPDNDAFIIAGDTLKIKQSPDFETKSIYNIGVKTTDAGGLSFVKQLTINVNDIDETGGNTGSNTAPTDLVLSAITVDENVADETIVGTFSTTDSDSGDTFIYSLDDSTNNDDNNAFIIDGNQLKIKESPDFETKSSYNIGVKTTDAGGLSFVKQLTINVNDIDETEEPTTGGNTQNQLVKIGDDVIQIISDQSKVTFEVNLRGNNSNSVKELAVFTVDDADGRVNGIAPGEDGYTQAALARSKVIFSAIANIPNQFDASNFKKLLEFNANDQLRFYIVQNGTTDSVQAGFTPLTNVIFPSLSSLNITKLSDDNFSVAWENLDIDIKATDNPLILGTNLQGNPEGESLDLRNVNGLVNAEFTVYREAAFDNYVGFYKVANENGGIDIDGDGTADILPGEAGYTQAAVNQHLSNFGLSVGNGQTATVSGTLEGGAIYVPFLIVNGRPDAVIDSNPNNDPAVYFTYLGANSDRVDHVRLLGDNTFGFEDLRGGGDFDYNDIVVKVNLQNIA
ncbi:DUF4114 domain-containing protein [Anabaena sp. UHCC 0451]|uniref:DUF4114 domain-containing protein n=1 Tax=Anabaena sp. UHCC 0451 TaxID=2055235 RepID=UPI002B20AD68|nr:DUF4114 domain-containing protein [Anabaena sp. UHCC 0451]MEA5577316.1 DUF4114 domain-containing protein [Anabaena sp. UHCC 0451]